MASFCKILFQLPSFLFAAYFFQLEWNAVYPHIIFQFYITFHYNEHYVSYVIRFNFWFPSNFKILRLHFVVVCNSKYLKFTLLINPDSIIILRNLPSIRFRQFKRNHYIKIHWYWNDNVYKIEYAHLSISHKIKMNIISHNFGNPWCLISY
jgi:hypothetical protein